MKIEIKSTKNLVERKFPRLMRGKMSRTLYLIEKRIDTHDDQYFAISLEKGGVSGIYFYGVSSFEEVDDISVTLSQ